MPLLTTDKAWFQTNLLMVFSNDVGWWGQRWVNFMPSFDLLLCLGLVKQFVVVVGGGGG